MFHHTLTRAVVAALVVTSFYSAPALAQEATASGEVRRVDAAAGKVTIRHGNIPALDLTAMTLVYRADPALLAGIQPGDKVKFTARRENGQYVIVAISR